MRRTVVVMHREMLDKRLERPPLDIAIRGEDNILWRRITGQKPRRWLFHSFRRGGARGQCRSRRRGVGRVRLIHGLERRIVAHVQRI